jgi:hypothetical protein
MNNKVSHKDLDCIYLARVRLQYWEHDNELAVEVRSEKSLTFRTAGTFFFREFYKRIFQDLWT